MADAFLIDTENIVDFENDTANAPADLDSTFAEIVAKYNAMINKTTGHYHDDVDSRNISAQVSGLTMTEFAIAQLMGFYT